MTVQTHPPGRRNLLVLGCTATKLDAGAELPALSLYDGPTFRVVRSFLRERAWPRSLSLAVLSAQHGLIGAMSPIAIYDQRMTRARADTLRAPVSAALRRLAEPHDNVELVLGQDYVRSLDDDVLANRRHHFAAGGIGHKLHRLHNFLRELASTERVAPEVRRTPDRPLYFLPDWDDFLDVDYDFGVDKFSASTRAARNERHSISMMRPHRLCDGVLVSLAQHLGTKKGLLRRITALDDHNALRPASIREHFALRDDQWAFGDCGAFSYVAEPEPTISVKQAVALYELHGFDFGASVDHIPVPVLYGPNGKREFTELQQRVRIKLTRENASTFLDEHDARGCTFVPVGVIQGLDAKSYAAQVPEYLEMGYDYLAIGGLVPRGDDDIQEIVKAVTAKIPRHGGIGVHLLGIYRPKLQCLFRELKVTSFDSATYFRKAWLRSDQNYLSSDGRWFAAVRVPPSSDPKTLAKLLESGKSEATIKRRERAAIDALHSYAKRKATAETVLEALLHYGKLFPEAERPTDAVVKRYQHVLDERPWEDCTCRMCRDIGIDVVIFRGLNRNKRRGAHNTLMLYQGIRSVKARGVDADDR
jgi:hypothetical protein